MAKLYFHKGFIGSFYHYVALLYIERDGCLFVLLCILNNLIFRMYILTINNINRKKMAYACPRVVLAVHVPILM